MRTHVNAMFVEAIREFRNDYLIQAGRAFVASHLTPTEVVRAYQLAGWRWVDQFPTLADRIKEDA